MSKKIRISVVLTIFFGGVVLYIAPAPSSNQVVEGIHISDLLVNGQTFLENYRYKLRVKDALQGDGSSFASPVMSWCGGGAGCYDDGEVLANILLRVGEGRFAKMAATLDYEEQSMLWGLLLAGFEYGYFPDKQQQPDFETLYPQLAKSLRQGKAN